MSRECGSCTACCTYFSIKVLDKAPLVPCPALVDGCTNCWTGPTEKNCTRYEDRPDVCGDYNCMWIYGNGEEEDRPDKSGMLLDNATPVANVLRALPVRKGADQTPEGIRAINNISRDRDQPVMVSGWPETRILRVVGRGPE